MSIGKGFTLAFFLIFLFMFTLPAPDCGAQQAGGLSFPVINRLNPTDNSFRQFISDVQANRRRLIGFRANLQEAAENLTIFQYTVRQGEDIFFLAARCNIPYSAIASLNRLNNPTALKEGMLILLPSCPGIFIPANIESDLEMIIGAARQHNEDAIELRITRQGRPQTYRFIPGADFTPTERGYFLHSGFFRFPLRSFRLTSPYGIRNDPFTGHPSMHQGIDLAAPEGTEVFAIADGVVTTVGNDPVLGIYIIITHSNNWTSLYGHLQKVETVLRSEVKSGTLIGRVGTTGRSTGPHLHFELRQDGRHFDPSERLRP
jgi:murein DD-endopeptidase MepM/ murein hydrolase activator NlpD